MTTGAVWLTKLVLAHLLTDFVFQPSGWVEDRSEKHFASARLYLHGLVTAIVACLFIGWAYWLVVSIILVTHIFIDGWKSYRPKKIRYFLIDQLLHLAVTAVCWGISGPDTAVIRDFIHRWNGYLHNWVMMPTRVLHMPVNGLELQSGSLSLSWCCKINIRPSDCWLRLKGLSASMKRTARRSRRSIW